MNRSSSPPSDAFGRTARSLASPSSPLPSSPTSPKRPAWPRSYSSTSRTPLWSRNTGSGRTNSLLATMRRFSASVSNGSGREAPWYIGLIRAGIDTVRGTWRLFMSLTLAQRIAIVLFFVVADALTVVALVYSERIYEWLAPRVGDMRSSPVTLVLLWTFTFLSAFPPLFGYSTCVTLAGFIYGMKGWFIASTANVVGSTLSFIVCRRYLSEWSQRLAARDTRIAAFTLVVQKDGFPLLCAIRMCPLPYALSNCGLSTISSIRALPFALATAAATPKLLIHVFIGSRLAALALSTGAGDEMDLGHKLANYLGIAVGVIVGVATGWIIYSRTVARARQLEAEDRERVEDERAGNGSGTGRARTTSHTPRATPFDGATIGLAAGLEPPEAFANESFREDIALDEEGDWMTGAEARDEIDFVGYTDSPDETGWGHSAARSSRPQRRTSGDTESNIGLLDKRQD